MEIIYLKCLKTGYSFIYGYPVIKTGIKVTRSRITHKDGIIGLTDNDRRCLEPGCKRTFWLIEHPKLPNYVGEIYPCYCLGQSIYQRIDNFELEITEDPSKTISQMMKEMQAKMGIVSTC